MGFRAKDEFKRLYNVTDTQKCCQGVAWIGQPSYKKTQQLPRFSSFLKFRWLWHKTDLAHLVDQFVSSPMIFKTNVWIFVIFFWHCSKTDNLLLVDNTAIGTTTSIKTDLAHLAEQYLQVHGLHCVSFFGTFCWKCLIFCPGGQYGYDHAKQSDSVARCKEA